MSKKITNENLKNDFIEFMIGKNECKHDQVLLLTTYLY